MRLNIKIVFVLAVKSLEVLILRDKCYTMGTVFCLKRKLLQILNLKMQYK